MPNTKTPNPKHKMQKDRREFYIYQCSECGRVSVNMFYLHGKYKKDMKACDGEVKRIKFKNAW